MATPTHLIIAVVISLVLLAGCVVPARLVSTAFAAQASVGIPFKGTIQEAVETHTVELPYMYVNGQGSGNATHLGLYTYSFQAKVRLPERIGEGLRDGSLFGGDRLTLFHIRRNVGLEFQSEYFRGDQKVSTKL
jgi:hypothetical protein